MCVEPRSFLIAARFWTQNEGPTALVQVAASAALIVTHLEQRSAQHDMPLTARLEHVRSVCASQAQLLLNSDGPRCLHGRAARSSVESSPEAAEPCPPRGRTCHCVELLQRSALAGRLLRLTCGSSASCRQTAMMFFEDLDRLLTKQAPSAGQLPRKCFAFVCPQCTVRLSTFLA